MTGAVGLWGAFWLVPTEVVGKGVLLQPDNAGLLDARAAGQVRQVHVAPGDTVRRGQVLIDLYLPVLDRQLEQQRANLRQLERQNVALDGRDRLRLAAEKQAVATALAKLGNDRARFGALKGTYASKLKQLDWLAAREVVAPLSAEVVGAEQGLTSTGVSLDQVRIEEKRLLSAYQQVKLQIETEALQRLYRIDDLRRELRVTEARRAFDGQLLADRDGQVLDLQVIPGQSVRVGQRLGTIGRSSETRPLRAVSYFPPRTPVGSSPAWPSRWCPSGTSAGASAASSAGWCG